ncbi:uncharacterized protein LOC125765095 [Anopheles funestus]|uniref:uncharacterized protein LOC125765095 n=1 Tax=Anopheles funestus TaxID=62324 RepID=UPI0020C5EFB1|nr:uncharacterized protein LOC125765095 [Anopheles funestus]
MPQLQDYKHVGEHLRNDANEVNEFITTERAYAVNDLDETLATLHLLNDEQRTVYDKITAAIDRVRISTSTTTDTDVNTNSTGIYNAEDNRFFFLDGPGVQSKRAELIRSRYALEAVDRTIRDITGVQRPFGGKVVLLSGDFRQILPIVPKGNDAQIINECIKRSTLWSLCTTLRLCVNMRVRTASNATRASELQEFANFLLRIGEGRHDTFAGADPSLAKIPHDMVVPRTANSALDINKLIARVNTSLEHPLTQ